MNLLTDAWIPIQARGQYQKITLQHLLCDEQSGELCLPRDDMELACLQLLCTIAQALITPKDKKELGKLVMEPLSIEAYTNACQEKLDWFDLNHHKTPFMQFRGVKSVQPTAMDKLLAGVADGTNKAFVNPQGLGEALCGGCSAIALFNAANNAPSMGGGFKGGLRGSTPITILVKGLYESESGQTQLDLRKTVWLNVMTEETAESVMPWYQDSKDQLPNYLEPIKADVKIPASRIGLNRGLLWQPAHFELLPALEMGRCSCCGCEEPVYTGFNKEKFNFTIEGIWPHPLSARSFTIKKGEKEERFPSFTTTAPTWTHLNRLVVDQLDDKGAGHEAAPVIKQARTIYSSSSRIELIVGGYRNNQATILERRHELFSLAQGWAEYGDIIHKIVSNGLAYKTVLRKSLYVFISGALINPGSKKNKDRISEICSSTEAVYYQQTEHLLQRTLATVNFDDPSDAITTLNNQLKIVVKTLFIQATSPYQQEPKMLRALALAKRSLNKSLQELEPEGEAA